MSKITLETKEKNISDLIRHQVVDVFREILSDPDRGLKLNKRTEERLKRSIRSKNEGKTTDLVEFLKQFG